MLSKISFRSVLPFLGFAAFIALSACSDNDAQPLSGPEYQIESNDQGKSSRSTDAKSSPRNRRPAFAQGKSSSSTDAKSSSSSKAKSSSSSKVGSSSSLQTSSSAVSSSSEAGVTACKTANVDNCAYLEPTEDLDSSSFCFDNDPAKCDTLGRLYLWSAAMDSAGKLIEPANGCGYGVYCSASGTSEAIRGICPAGWHLPSREELDTLAKVGELGLMSVSGWLNIEGVDSVGFSGLPSGYMVKETFLYDHAAFWSSTDISKGYLAYAFSLPDIPAATLASLGPSKAGEAGKYVAYSVRCVKD